jgi:hypothetical protein
MEQKYRKKIVGKRKSREQYKEGEGRGPSQSNTEEKCYK